MLCKFSHSTLRRSPLSALHSALCALHPELLSPLLLLCLLDLAFNPLLFGRFRRPGCNSFFLLFERISNKIVHLFYHFTFVCELGSVNLRPHLKEPFAVDPVGEFL